MSNYLSSIGLKITRHNVHEGCFSSAIRTKKCKYFTRINAEIEISHGNFGDFLFRKYFPDALKCLKYIETTQFRLHPTFRLHPGQLVLGPDASRAFAARTRCP